MRVIDACCLQHMMEFDFVTSHLHFMAYSMQEVRFMLQSCAHCQFGCLLPDEAKARLSVLHSHYRLIALIAMTIIIQSVGEMFAFSHELSKIRTRKYLRCGSVILAAQSPWEYRYRAKTMWRSCP